ncbi:hypothetical protein PFMC_00108 [Plasmodium falciparum CAMP/Malaysia]|uniref:Uncharacterized protein n=1 Tax=Plasmodium falciparum (isolate Camp / Malaysia) TaxID=5835 RepID=A0A024XF24_PLAFC|nr:hypothetical protein PFMC_00108 [Plasmodium falciparum CAMP/Malaysia]
MKTKRGTEKKRKEEKEKENLQANQREKQINLQFYSQPSFFLLFSNVLRANPFPEVTDLFCRLPLLTFFYLTRGY